MRGGREGLRRVRTTTLRGRREHANRQRGHVEIEREWTRRRNYRQRQMKHMLQGEGAIRALAMGR